MEGFKQNQKMQCFKEGGSVKYETRKEHKEEMKSDVDQDKAIVKKAIKMHDVQEHGGETTNLSKLRKGGRAKKANGTVKKFAKASGEYGAKKTDADIKRIKEAKQFKPSKMCGGGKAGKYAAGGEVKDPQALTDRIATQENLEDREMIMKPLRAIKNAAMSGYNKITGKDKADAPSAPVNQSSGSNINKKRGGKVC